MKPRAKLQNHPPHSPARTPLALAPAPLVAAAVAPWLRRGPGTYAAVLWRKPRASPSSPFLLRRFAPPHLMRPCTAQPRGLGFGDGANPPRLPPPVLRRPPRVRPRRRPAPAGRDLQRLSVPAAAHSAAPGRHPLRRRSPLRDPAQRATSSPLTLALLLSRPWRLQTLVSVGGQSSSSVIALAHPSLPFRCPEQRRRRSPQFSRPIWRQQVGRALLLSEGARLLQKKVYLQIPIWCSGHCQYQPQSEQRARLLHCLAIVAVYY